MQKPPQKQTNWYTIALIVAIFFSPAILQGCDAIIDSNAPDLDVAYDIAQNNKQDKFRHADLLDRAKKRQGPGKSGTPSLNMIIAIKPQKVLDRYKILDRYKVLDRYKILDRYEYQDVFNGFAISIEDEQGLEDYNTFLDQLEGDPDILWYEPDFGISLPNPSAMAAETGQKVPWSIASIGAIDSWAISGDGKGAVDVDVYILDTGVTNSDIDVVQSLDLRPGLSDPQDEDGHGTHIAGIIGAIDDGDGLVGIAPGARIHNLKVFNDDGQTDVSVVIAAVEHILHEKLQNPAKPVVVNMSLGENIGSENYTALDEAIKTASNAGVVFVVASGNQGINARLVTPAHAQEAITVGSFDVNGVFSEFSNFGPHIDLLAPGEGIISLAPSSGTGTPRAMSGTSMATAHVTGAAALYLAKNPSATTTEVANALKQQGKNFVVSNPASTTRTSVWVGETGPNCSLEGSLQAMGGQQVPFTVHNEAPYAIQMFWLNWDGNREDYGVIQPGGTWEISTFAEHPWVIARASDGVCQELVMTPGSKPVVTFAGSANAPQMSNTKTVLSVDDFESGVWWTENAWTVTDANSGNVAVELGWNASGVISYDLPASPGQTMTVTGQFKRNGSPNWTGFGIDFKNANGEEISETVKTISHNNGYDNVSHTFTIPSGTSIYTLWIVSNGGNGSLKVDDLCISEGTSCQNNVLPNPGFEQGMLFADNAWKTELAANGSGAFETGWRESSGFWKEIAADAGKTYNVSAMVQKAHNPDWVGFGIDFWDADGKKISQVLKTVTSQSYSRMSVGGIAPQGTVKISYWFWSNGTNGAFRVDDMILTEM